MQIVFRLLSYCAFLLFIGASLLWVFGTDNAPNVGLLIFNGVLGLCWLIALLVLHESAHVMATWVQGGSVWLIQLGIGRTRWMKRIGLAYLALGDWGIAGYCVISYPTQRFIRLRLFLSILAAPGLHLLCILLMLPFASADAFWTTLAWRETFILVNAYMLISSLWPQLVFLGDTIAPSDGLQLFALLCGKSSGSQLHINHLIHKVIAFEYTRKYEHALAISQEWLAMYPDNLSVRHIHAICLIHVGRYEEALTIYQMILAAPELMQESGINRALYFNNAAWAALHLKELEWAKRYSDQAFLMAPWIPHIRGTFGAVSVMNGDLENGIAHTLAVADEIIASGDERMATAVALNLAFAAKGKICLGELQQAADLLDDATSWDAHHVDVQQITTELNELTASK